MKRLLGLALALFGLAMPQTAGAKEGCNLSPADRGAPQPATRIRERNLRRFEIALDSFKAVANRYVSKHICYPEFITHELDREADLSAVKHSGKALHKEIERLAVVQKTLTDEDRLRLGRDVSSMSGIVRFMYDTYAEKVPEEQIIRNTDRESLS